MNQRNQVKAAITELDSAIELFELEKQSRMFKSASMVSQIELLTTIQGMKKAKRRLENIYTQLSLLQTPIISTEEFAANIINAHNQYTNWET